MLKDDIIKGLPKVVGKVFRDISGKGPERIYIEVVSNCVVVYITGYITSGLCNSKLFEDMTMRKATQTYYNKLSNNSMETVAEYMQEQFNIKVNAVMSDFNVVDNSGIIVYRTRKILCKDNKVINSTYSNFVRSKISEFMHSSTGAYPRVVELYNAQKDVYIFIGGFLGSFNETKYRYDNDLIEANKGFYYGILKGEFSTDINDYSVDELNFESAFCDVDILNDLAIVVLRGTKNG